MRNSHKRHIPYLAITFCSSPFSLDFKEQPLPHFHATSDASALLMNRSIDEESEKAFPTFSSTLKSVGSKTFSRDGDPRFSCGSRGLRALLKQRSDSQERVQYFV